MQKNNAIIQLEQNMPRGRKAVLMIMRLLVLAASLVMVVWISDETLRNKSFLTDHKYMDFQLWVCGLFMLDIIIEGSLSPRKLHYLFTHILFIIVSVPYLNVLEWMHVHVSGEALYLLKLVPLVRAGYVLMLVVRTITSRSRMAMLYVYISWMLVSVYFAAIMFFIEEFGINPTVDTIWTALWWAMLDITTVGSNIDPVTPVGKVLSTFLAAEGLILFPVFTVYITNAFVQSTKQKADPSVPKSGSTPTPPPTATPPSAPTPSAPAPSA